MDIIKHKNPTINRFARESLTNTADEFLRFQDPTIMGYKLMFQWNNPYGLFDQSKGGLNSALGYLNRIGDTTRAIYLEQFLNLIQQINTKTPWYFQTIEGLGDLWNRKLDEIYKDDRQINIGCLESLDLRITGMMDLYRKACFDWKHRKEVVPANLRKFDLWIYVYDWRMFNDFGDISDALLLKKRQEQLKLFGTDKFLFDTDDDLNIGRTANRFLFKLIDCEFLPNESNAHLENVSNIDATGVTQKISIRYYDYEEENVFNMFLDGKVSDTLLNALDNFALDLPTNNIFINPITGDNTIGNQSRSNIEEAIDKPEILDLIQNESQNAVFGNLLTLIPPQLRIFDEQSLVKYVGQRVDDLAGTVIGQLLLSNIDLFGDSGSLNNSSNVINDLLELSTNNPISNDLGDTINVNTFNNTSNVSDSIESNTSNNIEIVTDVIESNINPISNDLTNIENNISNNISVVSDSIETNNHNLLTTIQDVINGEAQIFLNDLNGSFKAVDAINDGLDGSFNNAVVLENDLDFNITIANNNITEITEEIESNVSNLLNSINDESINSNNNNTTTKISENIGGLVDSKNDEIINLNLVEATIINDDIENINIFTNVKSDGLDFELLSAKTQTVTNEINLTPANILIVDNNINLTPANVLITNDIEVSEFGTPILKGNLDGVFNEAIVLNGVLNSSEMETINIKNDVLNNIEYGNSLNNKTGDLNDKLNFNNNNEIEILKTTNDGIDNIIINRDNLDSEIVIKHIKEDDLNFTTIPADNKEQGLEDTKLDPYTPNYINPEKDC